MSSKIQKKSKLADKLERAIKEAIAHAQGKLVLKGLPPEFLPVGYKPKVVKRVRTKSKRSQGSFAKAPKVSARTVRSWESGQAVPARANARQLESVAKKLHAPSKNKR